MDAAGSGTDHLDDLVARIRSQAASGAFRVTQHAQQEMVEEGVLLDDILTAVASCELIENYPEHRRGACCLLLGFPPSGRALHVVCTTEQPLLIIITVYEPRPPKWATPRARR